MFFGGRNPPEWKVHWIFISRYWIFSSNKYKYKYTSSKSASAGEVTLVNTLDFVGSNMLGHRQTVWVNRHQPQSSAPLSALFLNATQVQTLRETVGCENWSWTWVRLVLPPKREFHMQHRILLLFIKDYLWNVSNALHFVFVSVHRISLTANKH